MPSICKLGFNKLFWILVVCCFNGGIHGLRCRSQDSASSEAEMKRVIRNCMQRSGSDDASRNADECTGMGGMGQCRRHGYQRTNFDNSYYAMEMDEGEGNQRSNGYDRPNYSYRFRRTAKQPDMNNNHSNNNRNNTGESGQCVAQCFFEEMNMVDGNGQPDRRKVSYMLTKDIRERELRNFYIETVQQCFRYLESFRYNKCMQSRELIKCMSEYAKAQCDDWQEHHNILFN